MVKLKVSLQRMIYLNSASPSERWSLPGISQPTVSAPFCGEAMEIIA